MTAAQHEPALDKDDLEQARALTPYKWWPRNILFQTKVEDHVRYQNYAGSGTAKDPYIIDYLQDDHEDAMSFPIARKRTMVVFHSLSIFAITFASSLYASGIGGVVKSFEVSEEIATLGLSLFVLGFAVGPLIWAPLSEVYGRAPIFALSYAAYTAISVGAIFSPNITSLLVLRFFASAFGSSSMVNAGGVIADMFKKEERGLMTGLFSTAPFLGPAFGKCYLSFIRVSIEVTPCI